jgi:hypothetical protein
MAMTTFWRTFYHVIKSAHPGKGGGTPILLYPYMYSVGLDVIFKEVIKEQPPARNLSAAVRRLLKSTNVVNKRPPF